MIKIEKTNNVRDAVIYLMDHIPEFSKLEGEEWFNTEDHLVELVETIIKENGGELK